MREDQRGALSRLSRRTLAVAALLTLVEAAPPLSAQEDASAFIARVEAARVPGGEGLQGLTLAQVIATAKVPGVSVAVIRDFQVHWAKGYGVADVATGRAVDTDTRFQAASISKPVTAMAALRLAQEGRLSIDQDVNQILKSWKVPVSEHNRAQPVTPRSLFSHTSGADDGFGFPGYDPALPRPTVVQILNGEKPSNVGPVLFARPPYRTYKNSGGGLSLMQLALTDVTGERFEDMMQRL